MKDVAIVAAIGVFVGGIVFMVWAHFSKYSSNKWFCNKMGWHLPPKAQGFDGCSFTGTCPRCNRSILQDGQGNWF